MVFTMEVSHKEEQQFPYLSDKKDNTSPALVQIYGPGGSGKSTLTLQLVSGILNQNPGKALWIDTENKFSARRLSNLSNSLDMDSMFLSQPKSLAEQDTIISGFSNNRLITEDVLGISAIVLDTTSNYIRNELKTNNFHNYSQCIQDFYETQILPLLLLQKKVGCVLILVHQSTYKPDIGTLPFMYNVFQKIPSAWFELIIDKENNCKYLDYRYQDERIKKVYKLGTGGVLKFFSQN